MSFRIEEKIVCTTHETAKLKETLIRSGMKTLYPERTIESTYFDTYCRSMFYDSEEGTLPRTKIRIRNYPDTELPAQLETKISSTEGRFKTNCKIIMDDTHIYLRNGIFNRRYGVCMPSIVVKYTRQYYSHQGIRITFDRNIMYNKYGSKFSVFDPLSVVEIKAHANTNVDFLEKLICAPRRRFSKFSRASMMAQ